MSFESKRMLPPVETTDEKPEQETENFGIEFQGKNYQLEFSKSEVTYPEQYAQETGILGYEKKTLSWATLQKVFRDILGKEVTNFSSLLEELKLIEGSSAKDYQEQNIGEKEKQLVLLLKELLNAATNDNFPQKTLNHTMNVFTASQKFGNAGQKTFEDKIFSPKFIMEEATTKGTGWSIDSAMPGVDRSWVILNSQTNQLADSGTNQSAPHRFALNNIRENSYVDQAEKDRIFSAVKGETKKEYLTSIAGGFISQEHKFWGWDSANGGSRAFRSMNIGFQNDAFIKEYADACIEQMRAANNLAPKHNIFPMQSILRAYYLKEIPNERFFHLIQTKMMDLEYMRQHGGLLSIEENDQALSSAYKNLPYQGGMGYGGSNEQDYYIPIFINHPTIPQLRFGHAKYASFPNEEGFNIVTLQHANKLPKIE